MKSNKTAQNSKPSHVSKGSVLADLGFSRAEQTEIRVKSDLSRDLVEHINSLDLTQKEIAKRLGVHQPHVSDLLGGRISRFSVGTLIQFAVKLNLDVRVELRAPKKKTEAKRSKSLVSTSEKSVRALAAV